MKVLIIEDEQPSAQKLIRLLRDVDLGIEVLQVLRSVEASVNWFLENPAPELIFMDIQLEDGLCFDIFENCRVEAPVIFTTAYDAYALKAFKVNSVDYLLKPVAPDELRQAIDKFTNIHRANNSKLDAVVRQLQPRRKERFLIKVGEHYKSLLTTNIYCFYITERCTFLFTDAGKSYPLDYSLDQVEQLVDPLLFFRVNRNYIINYYAIRDMIAYSSSRIKVILANWSEKEDIVVSRERVSEFKKWMDR